MATKLFLRSLLGNGVGNTDYFDMLTSAGASATTAATTTTASGNEIPWTQSAGGSIIRWVSGRFPSGGATLTSIDVSVWCHESGTAVNAGAGANFYKRSPSGVETLITTGPFLDGVEFTKTTPTEMTWTANIDDTAFAENDRLVFELLADNVGTMGNGTVTLTYDAADAATGDSFINLAETVAFKAEAAFLDTDNEEYGDAYNVGTVARIAQVALASAVFTASLAQGLASIPQDEITTIPPAPEEEYWQNPVRPEEARLYYRLPYLPDPEELPAGYLANAPGGIEDYWQIVWDLPTLRGLPYLPDGDDFVAPPAVGLEDGEWSAPPIVVASIYQPLPYLPDAEELPGSLSGQPDEDFWQNPVFSVPATLFQVLPYLPDAQDLPSGSLYGEPEEAYWQNQVAPIAGRLYQVLPYAHDAGEIFVAPFIGTDEDYWPSPVPTLIQPNKNLPLLLWDSGEIGTLVLIVEEEYWQNPVSPVPSRMYVVFPHLPDRENRSYGPVQGVDAFEISANPDVVMSISVWSNVEFDIG